MPTARVRWTGTGPGQRAWPGNWRRQRRLPRKESRERPWIPWDPGTFLEKTPEKPRETGKNLIGILQNEGGPFGRLAGFYREGRRILDKNTQEWYGVPNLDP